MAQHDGSDSEGGTPIGQIPLRKVSRAELEAQRRAAAEAARSNPMNRLVPYLDLFGRLSDSELSRLAGVPGETVAQLRKQVVAVNQALARYADLLPRLSDGELVRLTGASAKTIRFWRLCQPRATAAGVPGPVAESSSSPMSTEAGAPAARASESDSYPMASRAGGQTGPRRPVESGRSSDSGVRAVPTPVPRAPTPGPGADTQLGLTGAPFPGYDYDPNEPVEEEDDDGIVIGLNLSDV